VSTCRFHVFLAGRFCMSCMLCEFRQKLKLNVETQPNADVCEAQCTQLKIPVESADLKVDSEYYQYSHILVKT
jgi:hypothetical protein